MSRSTRTLVAVASMASFEAPLWRDGNVLETSGRLSNREVLVWSGLRRPERRRQWLAVRLLAKWAYLCRAASAGSAGEGGDAADDFELRVAGAGHLERFPASAYRQLDVLPRDGGASGRPFVCDRSRPAAVGISLSHTRGWVACALGSAEPIGVDVEAIEPRSPAFEQYAFGTDERRWIRRRAAARSDAAPALQTWLWSMKEAAFKTGLCAGGCPEIAIAVDDGIAHPVVKPTGARAALTANDVVVDGKRAQWMSVEMAGAVTTAVRFTERPVPWPGA